MGSFAYYFGIRAGEFRRLNGLTQRELAEEMGMTTSFITKMERGLKVPTLLNAIELACYLGVPFDWLTFDKGSFFDKPPSGLIRLAQMPRKHRMDVMNHLAEFTEAIWDILGESIEKCYGRLMGLPWKSPYWKVFAFFFVFEKLEEKHPGTYSRLFQCSAEKMLNMTDDLRSS